MIQKILRKIPAKIAIKLYYKFLNSRHSWFTPFFKSAELRYAPTVKMVDLMPGDVISGQLALNGFYEHKLTQSIQGLSQRQPGIFVDIGANLGYFSLIWLAGHPENKTISFEASPRIYPLLQKNIKVNSFEDKSTLIHKAAGDTSRMVSFDLGPEDQTGWGGITLSDSQQSIELEMVRMDEVVSSDISCLKIDVEGADTLVLKGCEKLLKEKKIKIIYFEQNQERMRQLGIGEREAEEFLSSVGYQCQPFDHQEWVATPMDD